ncbi:MAG TPA: SulP family inorganic anion transporter [Solibacterales bacterium]|nr:SulP family inorganic anion transporter [Bryobacterales bacterium]
MLRRAEWLRYSWSALAGDLSGGLIAALIALPYGLAMAALMGLPPVLGLFTSLLTSPITAILGRNPVLIGGTSSVTVPFIALAVASHGIGGAAKITIVAAVFMMVFCVLRLGRYISLVPTAVVSGFSCGIGAMMVISQLKTIFGVKAPAGFSGSMIGQFMQVVDNIDTMRWAPLALAVVVILAATALSKVAPKLPAPLIGVGLAMAAGSFFGLHEKEVGALPLEIPPFAGFAWTPVDVVKVLPSAFALAFVASVNILLTSRVVEHFRGKHHQTRRSDADTELGAYGIANVCAGIFGAPLSVGIPARSLANVRCGGVTRFSNLFHAVFLIAFLKLGSDVVSHIPLAALAGVTAWMGLCLLDWSTWRRLPKMRRTDAMAFLSTAFAVLLMNAVAAVFIGCSFYLVRWAYRRFWPAKPLALEPAEAPAD